MVVAGEDASLRSLQYTAPKRETLVTPCTRASRLRDVSVQKESCRGTPDEITRFRLLRISRTYEDAFVSQAGPKMICSSREDPSVLPRTLTSVRG